MTIVPATIEDSCSSGTVAMSRWSSSEPMPVSCVHPVAATPINAVSAMPTNVPNNAEVVRIDTPWARYRTTIMITVEPTTDTANGDSPARKAGSMNLVSANNVTAMPTSANSPRQRAIAMTSTAKIAARAIKGSPRRKSRNSYEASWPSGWIRISWISSPGEMPAL